MANYSSFPIGSKRRCRECGHIVTHRGWTLHLSTMHSGHRTIGYDVVIKNNGGRWVDKL